jgi:hypothetical protein
MRSSPGKTIIPFAFVLILPGGGHEAGRGVKGDFGDSWANKKGARLRWRSKEVTTKPTPPEIEFDSAF